jgi:hypothetical protein
VGCDGLGELGSGEGRVGLGELPGHLGDPSRREGRKLRGTGYLVGGDHGVGCEEGLGGFGAPPRCSGFELPCGVEAFVFDLGLVAPCGEDGLLAAGGVVGGAGGLQPVVDLLGAFGELVAQRLGYASDLGDVAPGPPCDAEPGGELASQGGLEHLASGADGAVQVGVDEGRPAAVGAGGEVGDQGVPVQQRVAGSAGAMAEHGGDHAVGGQGADPSGGGSFRVACGEVGEVCLVAAAASDVDGFTLEPAERVAQGRFPGVDDGGLDARVVGNGVED